MDGWMINFNRSNITLTGRDDSYDVGTLVFVAQDKMSNIKQEQGIKCQV